MTKTILLLPLLLFIAIGAASCGGGSSQDITNHNTPPSASNSVKLTWSPPTENTDSSPLQDLAGYKVYYGISANDLNTSYTISNPDASSTTVVGLTANTVYYFSVKAFNSKNIESDSSVIINKKTAG